LCADVQKNWQATIVGGVAVWFEVSEMQKDKTEDFEMAKEDLIYPEFPELRQ
jgi:hypothetical protein